MKIYLIKYWRSLSFLTLSFAVIGFCTLLPAAKVSNEVGVLLQLPETIGDLESKAVEMSKKEKFLLPDSTEYLKRTYFPVGQGTDSYNAISVSLIISRGDDRSLHRPAVCLDGQGWSIPHKQIKKLEIDGKTVEIMDLILDRDMNGKKLEAHYYYFWVGRGINTPSYGKMKLYSVWDNFTKNINHRWAYPGIFVYVNPHAENPQEDAWQRAQVVIKGSLKHFHKDFMVK